MPAANAYNPNDREQRQAATDELKGRNVLFSTAWAYYSGKVKQAFNTRAGEPDNNVVINLAKQVVDRTVSFLFPAMPTFEIEPNEPNAEQRLATLWRRAGGIQALLKLAKYGALGGTCYARMIPGEVVRIAALDPGNVITFWQADDIDNVLWHEIYWNVGKRAYRQDVVRTESGWAIYDWERSSEMMTEWTPTASAMWPYPTAPIVAWPHQGVPGQFYGANEIGDIKAADQINKVASEISRILRFHAAPRTVGIGFTTDDLVQTRIDGLWTVPAPEAQIFNLEMKGDLGSSMAFLDRLTGNYLQERRTVALAGKVEDFQRVTNLGMRALFIDALAKNEELRRNYETGLAAISAGMMALDGTLVEGEIVPHWPEPLPVDPLAQVQQLQVERELGIVSQETAARERGRDWQLEQERLGQEIDKEASVILAGLQQAPGVGGNEA